MKYLREDLIEFILANDPLAKREDLEKLSLTSLVIIKAEIEVKKMEND